MRITGFHVDGFGLLHDQQVSGIGPGTTVVLGPNEAGKSTLHAFLVRTLFGHPRANDADGRDRHEPLRGGRHGGVVVCEDDAGPWEVHRFTTGSPRLRVVAPDGTESTGTDAILPLLGRAVDATRFEQVFAIDLDDLAGIGSLAGDSLDDLLFDAATVGTGRSLRAARDEASDRRDALWTAAATKRPLARALDRRAAAREALAAARDAARANVDVRQRLDAVAARVEALADEQAVQAARIALLERVRDAWPVWSRAADLRARLTDLPDRAVELEVVTTARAAAADLAAAEQRHTALRAEHEQVDHARAAVQQDPDAVAVGDEVEALTEGLGTHELAVEQLAATEASLVAADRDAAAALADLGDGWTRDEVMAVATDAPSRERLVAAGDDLRDSAAAAAAATSAVREAERTASRRHDALVRAASSLPDAPAEHEVQAFEEALRVLRAGVPALETASSGAAAQTSPRTVWPVPVAIVAVVAGLVLVVPAVLGLLPADAPIGVVAGVGTVLSAIGAYLLGRARRGSVSDVQAVAPASEVAAEIAQAARRVGLQPRPTLRDVERVATRVDDARGRRRARVDAERHVARLRAESEEADGVLQDRRAVALDLQQRLTATTGRWREACRRVGVEPEDVRPTVIVHQRIATAQRALVAADGPREDVARIHPRVARFRDEATALADKLGHDARGQAAVRLLPGLRERVRRARAAKTEHDALAASVDQLERELEEAAEAVARARASVDRAMGAAGVKDLDALEQRARAAVSRTELAAELETTAATLAQLLGDGPRGDEARAFLQLADPTAWDEDLAAAREAAAATARDRDEALAERTRLAAELRRLGGDDAVPRAEQDLAAATAEVGDLAERWAVADAAARLLGATVERFEREQQPRVLTRASALLGRATGGQWVEVRRLDGQVVVARSEGGDPVSAAVLSRGTREQLWLCLRLALVEDLARERPLPLLVDDLLGTSDPERSLNVARVLAEVARGQQVWLFTCHPRTAELVTSVDPSAGVLRLRRGGHVVGLQRRDDPGPDGSSTLQFDL